MHFITLLRYGGSEGNLEGVHQGNYKSPVFHFENTGFAQLRYNSKTCQWTVISTTNYLPSLETKRAKAWRHD